MNSLNSASAAPSTPATPPARKDNHPRPDSCTAHQVSAPPPPPSHPPTHRHRGPTGPAQVNGPPHRPDPRTKQQIINKPTAAHTGGDACGGGKGAPVTQRDY